MKLERRIDLASPRAAACLALCAATGCSLVAPERAELSGRLADIVWEKPGRVDGLAMDDEAVYWSHLEDGASHGVIWLRDKGDKVAVFAGALDRPEHITVAKDHIFWTSGGSGASVLSLHETAAISDDPEVVDPEPGAFGIDAHGPGAVWTVPDAGEVRTTAGDATAVDGGVHRVAADRSLDLVFVTQPAGVVRLSAEGARALPTSSRPTDVHAADGRVFWIQESDDTRSIWASSSELDEASTEELAGGLAPFDRFAIDGAALFWATGTSVQRVGIHGGEVTTIAGGVDGCEGAIAASKASAHVYFACERHGTVRIARASKDP
jgi:hypothetical protein